MNRILLAVASALRFLAERLLVVGSWASPVLAAAAWCERRVWRGRFIAPETGKPAPTDGRTGGSR
ncbi:hypothetical protein [Methylobacterium sp. JK268]